MPQFVNPKLYGVINTLPLPMGSFGDRLRALREAKELTQDQLAKRVGVTRPHLSRIERGLVARPSMDLVARLASVVGWELIGPDVPRVAESTRRAVDARGGAALPPRPTFIERDFDYPQPYRSGPVAVPGEYAAGSPVDLDVSLDEAHVLNTSVRDVQSGRFTVIRVKGDSMLPRLKDGDLVLVDTHDKEPKPRRILAIYIRGEGGVLGTLHNVSGLWVVTKDNPEFPPIVLPEDSHEWMVQGAVKKRLEEKFE